MTLSLERCRTKLYQREKESKQFLELSEEQLAEVAKIIYQKQEMMEDTFPHKIDRMSNLERYYGTLKYLSNPLIHLELKTFDERIAYLIMMSDPNLVIFKEFLKLDLISLADISKVDDMQERIRLIGIRNQTLSTYETMVREKIGFCDFKLLKYEELFFKRFFGERELIIEVGCNNQDGLLAKSKLLRNFNNITDERYDELVEGAKTWLSLGPDKYNICAAAYSVLNQRSLLGLKSASEQLAMFILLVDSDLDMLRIYEEESMMPNVERRIIEEFGYYNQDLLTLEKKFHSRFCPDKKISIWTKTKKD